MWWQTTPRITVMSPSVPWIATLSAILTALSAPPLKKRNFAHLVEQAQYLRNSTTIPSLRGSWPEPEHSSSMRVPSPQTCAGNICPTEPRWPSDWPRTPCLSLWGPGDSASLIKYQLLVRRVQYLINTYNISVRGYSGSLYWDQYSQYGRGSFLDHQVLCQKSKIINLSKIEKTWSWSLGTFPSYVFDVLVIEVI